MAGQPHQSPPNAWRRYATMALGCAFLVTSAALIQHKVVLGLQWSEIRVHYFVVPTLVGAFFGLLIVHVQLMKEQLERLSQTLLERESQVKALNGQLAAMVESKSNALEQTQNELAHVQKTELAGQLAGGIAHDFNNLLTIVFGAVDELVEMLPAETQEHRLATEILGAAERATSLTQQLLHFSHKQVVQPTTFDASKALRGLVPMLERALGRSVTLHTELDERLIVRADRGQLDQVVVNLVLNARDALPDGGNITLAAHHVSRRGGDVILIAVEDDGVGMTAETLKHVTEPFFTTKTQGKGTGLGLSVVQRIVSTSSGELQIHSTPHVGTKVEVSLPEVNTESSLTTPVKAIDLPLVDNVLLVEDDAVLREFVSKILRTAGCEVFEAGDVRQALELLEASPDGIQVILSDVVLPDGSGLDVVQWAKERRAPIRSLLMTGYAAADLSQRITAENLNVLHKPFTGAKLIERLRALR